MIYINGITSCNVWMVVHAPKNQRSWVGQPKVTLFFSGNLYSHSGAGGPCRKENHQKLITTGLEPLALRVICFLNAEKVGLCPLPFFGSIFHIFWDGHEYLCGIFMYLPLCPYPNYSRTTLPGSPEQGLAGSIAFRRWVNGLATSCSWQKNYQFHGVRKGSISYQKFGYDWF